MGKVALFAKPKVEPKRPWRPTEADIQRYGRQQGKAAAKQKGAC